MSGPLGQGQARGRGEDTAHMARTNRRPAGPAAACAQDSPSTHVGSCGRSSAQQASVPPPSPGFSRAERKNSCLWDCPPEGSALGRGQHKPGVPGSLQGGAANRKPWEGPAEQVTCGVLAVTALPRFYRWGGPPRFPCSTGPQSSRETAGGKSPLGSLAAQQSRPPTTTRPWGLRSPCLGWQHEVIRDSLGHLGNRMAEGSTCPCQVGLGGRPPRLCELWAATRTPP